MNKEELERAFAAAIRLKDYETAQKIEQELAALGAGVPDTNEKNSDNLLQMMMGPSEALLSVGSAAGAQVAAGIAGTAGLVADAFGAGGEGIDTADRWVRGTEDFLTYRPRTRTGQIVLETFGKTVEPIIDAGNIVASGVVGAATLPAGVDTSAEQISQVQEQGIGAYLGDKVLDATDSPFAATAANLSPEAAMLLFGLKKPKPKETPAYAQPQQPRPQSATQQQTDAVANAEQVGEVYQGLQAGKVRSAEAVMPDRDIMAAAEELGIDLNPSHYSNSAAYREIEQALKSRISQNSLSEREMRAIEALKQRADELVESAGGSIDRGVVDASLRSRFDDLIKELDASGFYKTVDDAIPGSTRVRADNVREYLETTLATLGDKKHLTGPEKKLYAMLKDGKTPTYAVLDRVRRDIGRGYKRQGPFADEDSYILDKTYAAIAKDQQAIADAFGVGDAYRAGREIVAKRKNIESALTDIYGRNLSGSLIRELDASANRLVQGDVSNFTNLMKSVPEGMRQDVAVAVMQSILGHGSRSKSFGQGFKTAWEQLNRNKTAKDALFAYLPDDIARRFDLIGRVSYGLYRAKALENTSRTARDVIAAIDDGRMFGKIMRATTRAAVAETATSSMGMPGAGVAAAGAASWVTRKTKPSDVAEKLIGSKKFQQAIKKHADGDAAAAEQVIRSDPAFMRWVKSIPKSEAQQIAKIGFISWLVQAEETE